MQFPGIGVMLKALGGNQRNVEAHQKMMGRVIEQVFMEGDALLFHFKDGLKVKVWDDGQSCCENRYMTTDDDLSNFAGTRFVDMELRDGPTTNDPYGEPHETQFLLVNTDKGTFTMCTHNEHNGYYGGFWIVIEEMEG
jgi:hypothetical protein